MLDKRQTKFTCWRSFFIVASRFPCFLLSCSPSAITCRQGPVPPTQCKLPNWSRHRLLPPWADQADTGCHHIEPKEQAGQSICQGVAALSRQCGSLRTYLGYNVVLLFQQFIHAVELFRAPPQGITLLGQGIHLHPATGREAAAHRAARLAACPVSCLQSSQEHDCVSWPTMKGDATQLVPCGGSC